MGLRERKRRQTRQQIVEAAFELFDQHGYVGTTVEMIAERAVVSPRTVYRYFTAKEAIVFTALDGEIERITAKVRARCADGVTMRRLLAALGEQFAERQREAYFTTLTALMAESSDLTNQADSWRRQLISAVANEIAELRGEPAPDVGDAAMAATAVTISATAISWWARHDQRGDLSQLVVDAGEVVNDAWQDPGR